MLATLGDALVLLVVSVSLIVALTLAALILKVTGLLKYLPTDILKRGS